MSIHYLDSSVLQMFKEPVHTLGWIRYKGFEVPVAEILKPLKPGPYIGFFTRSLLNLILRKYWETVPKDSQGVSLGSLQNDTSETRLILEKSTFDDFEKCIWKFVDTAPISPNDLETFRMIIGYDENLLRQSYRKSVDREPYKKISWEKFESLKHIQKVAVTEQYQNLIDPPNVGFVIYVQGSSIPYMLSCRYDFKAKKLIPPI